MDAAVLRNSLTDLLAAAVADGIAPGFGCRVDRGGDSVEVWTGSRETHAADGTPLPDDAREPMGPDVVFDLASLTKIATALTILRLCDEGALDLDELVGTHLAPWRQGDKAAATPRHLLTHTAGCRPIWAVWQALPGASRDELVADMVAQPLATAPGTAMTYSCVGYMTAMALAEAATGERWEDLVQRCTLDPLGLGLTFHPDPAACAPTEIDGARGLVRGIVHDEAACSLGGVSGNAGLFGTLDDVARLGRAVAVELGGREPGLLSDAGRRALAEDQLPRLLGRVTPENSEGYGQSCGLRIGQASWMGAGGAQAHGHTGFTGTSILVDPDGLVTTLLSNRVHPTRNGPDTQPTRARVADLARTWA